MSTRRKPSRSARSQSLSARNSSSLCATATHRGYCPCASGSNRAPTCSVVVRPRLHTRSSTTSSMATSR
jgi:hypothetical protein